MACLGKKTLFLAVGSVCLSDNGIGPHEQPGTYLVFKFLDGGNTLKFFALLNFNDKFFRYILPDRFVLVHFLFFLYLLLGCCCCWSFLSGFGGIYSLITVLIYMGTVDELCHISNNLYSFDCTLNARIKQFLPVFNSRDRVRNSWLF